MVLSNVAHAHCDIFTIWAADLDCRNDGRMHYVGYTLASAWNSGDNLKTYLLAGPNHNHHLLAPCQLSRSLSRWITGQYHILQHHCGHKGDWAWRTGLHDRNNINTHHARWVLRWYGCRWTWWNDRDEISRHCSRWVMR